jgi:hypothetical protein
MRMGIYDSVMPKKFYPNLSALMISFISTRIHQDCTDFPIYFFNRKSGAHGKQHREGTGPTHLNSFNCINLRTHNFVIARSPAGRRGNLKTEIASVTAFPRNDSRYRTL